MRHRRTCPPGHLCLETVTVSLAFLAVIVTCFFFCGNLTKPTVSSSSSSSSSSIASSSFFPTVTTTDSPLYLIRTKPNSSFHTVGYLTPTDGTADKIQTLMGRPLSRQREKWQYYTLTDQMNPVQLPIEVKGRDSMNEYGCDELMAGDTILIPSTRRTCRVDMYPRTETLYVSYL